jgi:DNA-binding response OmpR family regulator
MLDQAPSARRNDKYPNLRGKRILVVEDDAVIAVDYYFHLREVGAMPQAYEPTNKAALDYLASHEVDAAIVDYRLRDGPCDPVLQMLQSRRIPFIVVSGCTFEMHASASNPHVLSKPATPTEVWRALSEVLH